jgi:hypothetical protein
MSAAHLLEAGAAREGLTTHRVETVAGDGPGTCRSIPVRISGGRHRNKVSTERPADS